MGIVKLLIVSLTTALPFVLYNQALTSSLFQLPFLFLLLELKGWKVLGRGSSEFSLSEFYLHVFSPSHLSSFLTTHPFSFLFILVLLLFRRSINVLRFLFYHILEYNYTVLLYCSFSRPPLFRHQYPIYLYIYSLVCEPQTLSLYIYIYISSTWLLYNLIYIYIL